MYAMCLRSFFVTTYVATVVWGSAALADGSSLPYANGGFSHGFGAIADPINRSDELFRIEGTCRSACTMFLSLRKVCIDENATLLFHGGRPGYGQKSPERMLHTYNAKLRNFITINHYMDTSEFHAISGRDMIEKFGYRKCPMK
jgi:hypothetical protein